MKFGSVCSGIEAASVAFSPLGWQAAWFAEIEPFPCAVLAHHYPNVPNLGDMTKFESWNDEPIDLLCGGTPCQSFSVAGLRKGLDDPRGNIMLTFGAIAAKYRPRWLVWENVPGVLSSNGGSDFGSFLGMLGQLGYGFAYRILDSQYFGVAQRRRRVFVVGCLGDWRAAAAVLFERHSLQGHSAPRREARKGVAGGVEIGPSGGRLTDLNPTLDTGAKDGPIRNQLAGAVMSPHPHASISPTLKARDYKGVSSDGDGDGAILVPMLSGAICKESFSGGAGGRPEGAAGGHFLPVAFPANLSGTQCAAEENLSPSMAVRRLTPVECERLQGFPDDYTAIPWRKKPASECPDGPRYKALGNSWAVPVVNWIGRRIDLVDELIPNLEAA